MNTHKAIFAIFRSRSEIRNALASLKKMGLKDSQLWVLQSKKDGKQDFTQVQKYQIKKSAMIGGLVGAVLFGVFSFFAIGDFFHSNSVFGFQSGAGVPISIFIIIFGALIGIGGGALVGIGIPDRAAKRYGQYLQAGGILLSVESDQSEHSQQAIEIKQALTIAGGQDIQLVDETKTWESANLERISLEALQDQSQDRSIGQKIRIQDKLDRQEHYDLDGVTVINGAISAGARTSVQKFN